MVGQRERESELGAFADANGFKIRIVDTTPERSMVAEKGGSGWQAHFEIWTRGSTLHKEFEAIIRSGITVYVGGEDYPLKFHGFASTPAAALDNARRDATDSVKKILTSLW